MRRKKLANKIVSILMAGLMLVSTPMSALATDGEIQQMEDQIEVQTSMDNEEITENDDSLTEEMIGEDAEENVILQEEDCNRKQQGRDHRKEGRKDKDHSQIR